MVRDFLYNVAVAIGSHGLGNLIAATVLYLR